MVKNKVMRRIMDPIMVEEWIGRTAKVVHASNPALIGLEGKIVDEKMNALVLQTRAGRKLVPKAGTTFALDAEGRTVLIEGSDALVRPHERTKKLYRKIK